MKISDAEQKAIIAVIDAGKKFGFGNLISHLQTTWARRLMSDADLSEKVARAATGGPGYPFEMQDDLITDGEWDETGEKYRAKKAK